MRINSSAKPIEHYRPGRRIAKDYLLFCHINHHGSIYNAIAIRVDRYAVGVVAKNCDPSHLARVGGMAPNRVVAGPFEIG